MKRQERVFALVQAMTKSEKAFFTKFAQVNTKRVKPDYLRLFEALVRQEVYDENKIREEFAGETFLKSYSAKKKHLTHKILESLHLLYMDRAINDELLQAVNFIGILFEKELYLEFDKKLRCTKSKALQYEEFDVLIKIVSWEKRDLVKDPANISIEEYSSLSKEQNRYKENYFEQMAYQDLYQQMILCWYGDRKLKTEKTKTLYEQFLKESNLGEPGLCSANKVACNYYKIKVLHLCSQDKKEECMPYIKRLSDLWGKHPFLKKDQGFKEFLKLNFKIAKI